MAPEDPDAVAALADALGSDDFAVYYEAAKALTHSGAAAKDALPALLHALHTREYDGGPWVYVVRTLKDIGPEAKAAIPDLEMAPHNDHPHTRQEAADALKKIRGE